MGRPSTREEPPTKSATANPNLFCECPDDRCAGYHHAVGDPCGCVPLPLACAVCGHETDAHPRADACDLRPADACQPIGAPADAVASTREAMLEAGRREADARAAFLAGTGTAEAMRAAVEAWIEAVRVHRDAVAGEADAVATMNALILPDALGDDDAPSTPGALADALRLAESVEAACEEALAGGWCGVAVVEGVPSVDPAVPYGVLWEFSTREAYRARCGQLGGAS